ncbi:MAG: TIGR00730 family Rossman fold protein [Planctomycetales bacterium]|nr:TIGR00730 family Rossman fold protein [Planctomycetales bacterium]
MKEFTVKLTFLGANRNVTGSRYCLESAGSRVMIDCGMVQEREFLARNWERCPAPPESLDALVLTHAHIDHIGLIPKLVADGYDKPIYGTHPTVALAEVMLKDSAKIQMEDAKYKKRRHRKEGRKGPHTELPLYTDAEVAKTLRLLRGVDYNEAIEAAPGLDVTWHDAGHILGSATLEIVAREQNTQRTFLFSGDIGQHDKPLIHDPTFFRQADYVIMESTYGDRDHHQNNGIENQLEKIANETIGSGGNLVIPVFAVERAQEMMFFFSRLVHEDRIPDVPIFLDSPMAYDATNIFRRFTDWLDDETRRYIASDEPPLRFPGLRLVRTTDESKAINHVQGPCIIMAPAGMCNAGRIKHHLRNNVRNPNSTILFVGYQAAGTLGRRLISGERAVRIHGREYHVEARVTQITGLSGHADRAGLLEWVGSFETPPRKIFLTHGDEESALALADAIRDQFHFPVEIPHYGDVVEIHDQGPSLVDERGVVARPAKRTASVPAETPIAPSPKGAAASTGPVGSTAPAPCPEHPDFEFLDSSARRATSYLYEDPWRVLRIQSDMIQGLEVMARALEGRRRAVSVFGSARLPSDDPAYAAARETSRCVGERGFAIITGGGPGIMEAANRGARDAGTISIGLNIHLPEEQTLNPYCDAHYTCHYFFVRKTLFAKHSRAFLIFPGGLGTLDELFEALTLIQTGKLAEFPVALIGSDYWAPMIDWLKDTVLTRGCIGQDDLERFRILDDPEEVAQWLDETINGR